MLNVAKVFIRHTFLFMKGIKSAQTKIPPSGPEVAPMAVLTIWNSVPRFWAPKARPMLSTPYNAAIK